MGDDPEKYTNIFVSCNTWYENVLINVFVIFFVIFPFASWVIVIAVKDKCWTLKTKKAPRDAEYYFPTQYYYVDWNIVWNKTEVFLLMSPALLVLSLWWI